jgi:hypothetical protein
MSSKRLCPSCSWDRLLCLTCNISSFNSNHFRASMFCFALQKILWGASIRASGLYWHVNVGSLSTSCSVKSVSNQSQISFKSSLKSSLKFWFYWVCDSVAWLKKLNIWYLRLRFSKSRDRIANPIEPEFETGFETGFETDLKLIWNWFDTEWGWMGHGEPAFTCQYQPEAPVKVYPRGCCPKSADFNRDAFFWVCLRLYWYLILS